MLRPLATFLPLLLLPATHAALPAINTTALLPWTIPHLGTHSPSGYPANHPYSTLAFTVTDPNTITLGTTRFGDASFPAASVNCSVAWLGYSGVGDNPRDGGWTTPCGGGTLDGVGGAQGRWTFRVVNGTGGGLTTDFGVVVAREQAVILANGGVVRAKFEGTGLFRVGADGNMGGSCGGSGVCNWGLKAEAAPVVVTPTLVELKCVAGTCDV